MPQSFGSIQLHYIFSTKHRQSWLTTDICNRLYPFVGGLARDRKCVLMRMGGIADHVHLLVQSARDIAPSTFVGEIKSLSSGWIHTEFPAIKEFGWQSGYGVFSVSHSGIAEVMRYIGHQAEHHRTKTFQEEYREFLLKHSMVIDERYVWD